jgi:hypothetical protein
MTRLDANLAIIDIIASYAKAYPTLRFGQILTNLDVATHRTSDHGYLDIFNEEPQSTLQRVTDSLPRID